MHAVEKFGPIFFSFCKFPERLRAFRNCQSGNFLGIPFKW